MLVEGIPQAATQNPSSSLPTLPVANKNHPRLALPGLRAPSQGPLLQGDTPGARLSLSFSQTCDHPGIRLCP